MWPFRRSGWTIETLKEHVDSLRAADQRALAIKEEADKTALGLARDIQVYKDEKANELREQLARERGEYARKSDLDAAQERTEVALKPLTEYVTAQQGRSQGISASVALLLSVAVLAVAVVSVVLVSHRSHSPAPIIVTVTVPAP